MARGARKALVLVTDAYGGRGGIALYCRNVLRALCEDLSIVRVIAIPRKVFYDIEDVPDKLDYRTDGARGKLKFLVTCLRVAITERRIDLIICAHIHLLPVARILGFFYRCPVLSIVYGLEAWEPTPRRLVNYLCKHITSFISIRKWTAERFIAWTGNRAATYSYLPNCIDLASYGIQAPRKDLIARYKLESKKVLMTAGRLDAGADLNKGFDEILEVLPELLRHVPSLVYLVMGDGEDKPRLQEKARQLGVAQAVIFTGYVAEAGKADHYRLADVFAMPGSHPKFDRYLYRFVFLEALACGLPVVGSRPEHTSDTSEQEANLIIQVDPTNKDEIISAILMALATSRQIRDELKSFNYETFRSRFHAIIDETLSSHALKQRMFFL
jgi:glycosyltransferase involved in cell wall biosynthesis